MSYEIPTDRRYVESHEWIENTDEEGIYRVGITDFAQDELGDIIFVEFPQEGDEFEQGVEFAVVESIKAISDIYLPVAGTIESVNDSIADQPELINEDPYGSGWLVTISTDSSIDHLLTADDYEAKL